VIPQLLFRDGSAAVSVDRVEERVSVRVDLVDEVGVVGAEPWCLAEWRVLEEAGAQLVARDGAVGIAVELLEDDVDGGLAVARLG